MNNLIEDLRKYFETTSREKVLDDWDQTKELDEIGPPLDELISETNWYFKVKSTDPLKGCNIDESNFSLKFSSGFFIGKK